jgi:hypothetical protein
MPRRGTKAESETPAEDDAPATASPTKADDAPESLFATLDDVTEYLRLVYWGPEGGGKTTAALAGTALGNVLVINAEGGLKIKALRRQGIDTSRVQIWPDPSKPTRITHKALDALYRRLKAQFEKDPDAFAVVVIDSASEVNLQLTGSVSDDRIKKDMVVDPFDKFFTDRSDYGTSGKMFRDLLRKFRSLPCHLVITALERRDEDEDTHKVTYGPAVSPAVQQDLAGQMDVIVYCRPAQGQAPYRALVRGSSKYRTKDRFGTLPDVLAEPSFTRVLGYVEEEIDESTDDLQKTLTPKKRKDTDEDNENEE